MTDQDGLKHPWSIPFGLRTGYNVKLKMIGLLMGTNIYNTDVICMAAVMVPFKNDELVRLTNKATENGKILRDWLRELALKQLE